MQILGFNKYFNVFHNQDQVEIDVLWITKRKKMGMTWKKGFKVDELKATATATKDLGITVTKGVQQTMGMKKSSQKLNGRKMVMKMGGQW